MFVLVKIKDSKYNITSAFVDSHFCSHENYKNILLQTMQKRHPDVEILSITPVNEKFYNTYKNYDFRTAMFYLYQESESAKKKERKEKVKSFFSQIVRRNNHAC